MLVPHLLKRGDDYGVFMISLWMNRRTKSASGDAHRVDERTGVNFFVERNVDTSASSPVVSSRRSR